MADSIVYGIYSLNEIYKLIIGYFWSFYIKIEIPFFRLRYILVTEVSNEDC